MKLTKRETILIVIVLIAGLSVLFYNYVYTPVQKKIADKQIVHDELVDKVDQAKLLKIELATLESELEELEASTEEYYDGLMEMWDQADHLVYAEELFGKLCDNVVLNLFEPVNISTMRAVDVGYSIVTNYSNLEKILDYFENGNYYCTIQSLNIVPESDSEVQWKPQDLEVNLTVRFYSKSQSEEYPESYDFMDGKYNQNDLNIK